MYGRDIDDPNNKEGEEINMFHQEAAIKDDASNIGRSRKGSHIEYQEREEAFVGKDLNDDRLREGTEQNFFQREGALYSRQKSGVSKNATEANFFKHDEAVRGDISSNDRSVHQTQQNYFANEDKAEVGRPDSYARFKSDI